MHNGHLGMWVWYTHTIKKTYHYKIKDGSKETSHYSAPIYGHANGMIIGERWLPDGKTKYPGSDSAYFDRTGSTHCYLVVNGAHTKPVQVDPEHTYILDENRVANVDDALFSTLMEGKDG